MWVLESTQKLSVCTYHNKDSRNTFIKGLQTRWAINSPVAKFLALSREEDLHDLPRSGELIKDPPAERGALSCPERRLTTNRTSEMGSSLEGEHTFQQQQGPMTGKGLTTRYVAYGVLGSGALSSRAEAGHKAQTGSHRLIASPCSEGSIP